MWKFHQNWLSWGVSGGGMGAVHYGITRGSEAQLYSPGCTGQLNINQNQLKWKLGQKILYASNFIFKNSTYNIPIVHRHSSSDDWQLSGECGGALHDTPHVECHRDNAPHKYPHWRHWRNGPTLLCETLQSNTLSALWLHLLLNFGLVQKSSCYLPAAQWTMQAAGCHWKSN